MTLNTAETQGKDPILGNKDTHVQEAILDPDILQQIIDINPHIEIRKTEHMKTHTTVDHIMIPIPKAQAEVDQTTTEKDQIPSIEIGHLQ